jgi:hypothetical protein
MVQGNEFRGIVGGFFLAIGLNILACVLFAMLAGLFESLQLLLVSSYFLLLTFGIGLSQLIYIVPIAIRFSKRRQWGRMKGVIIGAVATALLNGGCFLMIGGIKF